MPNARNFDVIIIGAGAAGLMCAMTAGARGKSVLLLDHADAVGKKILISGGGRCNFTNLHCTAENFLSANKHFCKSALARYSQQDFIALIDKHRIAWHEKTLGQLFCDTSARDVVAMLLAECAAAHVDIRLAHRITDISRHDRFEVATDKGVFTAISLVLASGGLSIPKMGATGFAHDAAEKFGLKLANVRPGLVPLTLQGDDKALAMPLSGVATPCIATFGKTKFREAILFTHRGLSGPAVLQISSYWQPGQTVTFNLLPDVDLKSFLLDAKCRHAKQEIQTVLARQLPTRLASGLLDAFAVHGACGAWGTIAVGLFTVKAYSYNLNGYCGAFSAGCDGRLLGYQLAFVMSVFAWVGVFSTVMFLFLRAIGMFRVSKEVEEEGLDSHEHTTHTSLPISRKGVEAALE